MEINRKKKQLSCDNSFSSPIIIPILMIFILLFFLCDYVNLYLWKHWKNPFIQSHLCYCCRHRAKGYYASAKICFFFTLLIENFIWRERKRQRQKFSWIRSFSSYRCRLSNCLHLVVFYLLPVGVDTKNKWFRCRNELFHSSIVQWHLKNEKTTFGRKRFFTIAIVSMSQRWRSLKKRKIRNHIYSIWFSWVDLNDPIVSFSFYSMDVHNYCYIADRFLTIHLFDKRKKHAQERNRFIFLLSKKCLENVNGWIYVYVLFIFLDKIVCPVCRFCHFSLKMHSDLIEETENEYMRTLTELFTSVWNSYLLSFCSFYDSIANTTC